MSDAPARIPSGPVPTAARAQGVYLYDTEGRDYLDGSSGPVSVNIGHGVPEVLDALRQQSEQLVFAYRTQFNSAPLKELTREVLALSGPKFREVVYTNSGSEATEVALRLALHHHAVNGKPNRTAVLTQFPSYHGMTAGALGSSGHPSRRANLAGLHDHTAGTVPVRSSSPELLPDGEDWATAFSAVGPSRVAAVLIEPVGGAAGGAAVVPDEVLRRLAELCRESGALLVADEVMTGFGRAGAWFAHQHAGVTPDLVVTGKGLSGGYTPIGACLVGDGVLSGQAAAEVAFGHTMSGNPLSAAIALAVLGYTRDHRLPDRARETGRILRNRLAELAGRFSFLGEPRGRGMLLSLPVRQGPDSYAAAPLAPSICRTAQRHGLVVYPAGVDHRSQAVLVAPPLTITEPDIDVLIARLATALASTDRELRE